MQASHKPHKFPLMPLTHQGGTITGNIFPEGRTSLPVQEFLGGVRANDIVTKKILTFKKKDENMEESYDTYVHQSVDPDSKNDIVNRLQDIHIRKMTTALTKLTKTRASSLL